MALVIGVILLLFIFITPALAVYPRLLQTPLSAISIPIVSTLIIFVVACLLISLGQYNHVMVSSITLMMLMCALVRTFYFYAKNNFLWGKDEVLILMVNGLILLPLVVICYYSSFNSNDEIYSWGLWALQHYQSIPPSFNISGSAYPQCFALIISYCYQLVGSVEAQAAVKIACLIFPLVLMQIIANASSKTSSYFFLYLITLFLSVFPGDFYFFYSKAYADPMMIASLLAGIYFFVNYIKKQQLLFLWLSVVSSITAALIKQPALWWSLVVFPIGLLFDIFHKKEHRLEKILSIVVVIFSLCYVLNVSGTILQNNYVVRASMHDRGIASQLITSFQKYFLHQPLLGILFLIAFIAVLRQSLFMMLYIFLIIPFTLMWWMLGAYQLRLGVHVTALCGLIIASTHYFPFSNKLNHFNRLELTIKKFILLFFVATTVAVSYIVKFNYFNDYIIYPMQGGRTTLNSMYGSNGDFLYQHIYNNPKVSVWVGDPFSYGALYGHVKLFYPDSYDFDKKEKYNLLADLKEKLPDYLITPGRTPNHYPYFAEQLINQCPQAFIKVSEANKHYQFIIYELNKNKLLSCR